MKKNSLLFVSIVIMMGLVSSCGGDDDNLENSSNTGTESNGTTGLDAMYESKLMGTSWKQSKRFFYYDDGREKTQDPIPGIMTLGLNHEFFLIDYEGKYDAYGTWEVINGRLNAYISETNYLEGKYSLLGSLLGAHYIGNEIKSLNGSKLELKSTSNKDFAEFYKVTYQEDSSFSNGNAEDGDNYKDEPPYVTSFDFTATKSSITVKFMCSERPTSATIKYGTSSPTSTASSSISGKQVSATVSGLKSGTKYYFKCTVKNSYGSSSSDTFSAITNY